MYIVTGGAGFIGSHIVKALNGRGHTDILVVDDLTNGRKCVNLADCVIADYLDVNEFSRAITTNSLPGPVTAILHQGACTDTMEWDGRYMMETNFTFSKDLFRFAASCEAPLVYASSAAVYGAQRVFAETPENERPINVYGYSKLAFDQFVRANLEKVNNTVVGLRYFNVYGARETRKGRMASMVYQLYRQLRENSVARLFEGTDGYADGDQRRDFVSVQDIVDLNLFFAEQSEVQGIVNAGTGASRSFNDIARCLIDLLGQGKIEYIPFNKDLIGKYQSFTEADLTNLRVLGYDREFTELEVGIKEAVEGYLLFDRL